METISVIVPTYNSSSYLDRALASIYAQTYPANWEVIVVDDGSTDDTRQKITSQYSQIQYIYQSNQGPAAARNRGLKQASSEWITFLDADDCWPPDRTKVLMTLLQANPGLAAVWGLVQIVFEDAQEAKRWTFKYEDQQRFDVNLGARLFRRVAFEQVGLLDETMRYCEDLDWFYRAKEANLPMQAVERCTLLYHVHSHGITHQQNLNYSNLLVLKKSLDRRRGTTMPVLPRVSDYARS